MTTSSTSTPRPRKDQQRNRRALLEAAREIFGERGLDAPLDDIAKRAGLGNATIYRHFTDRRGLIVALVVDSLTRHEDIIEEAMAMPDAWQGFTHYLEFLFTEQLRDMGYLSALRAIPTGDSEEVDHLRARTIRGFTDLIDRAKDEGTFRADAWIEDVLLMVYANEQLMHLGKTPHAAASRRFLDLAAASVRTPTTTTTPDPRPAAPPADVLTLRGSLIHDLAGHPLRPGGPASR